MALDRETGELLKMFVAHSEKQTQVVVKQTEVVANQTEAMRSLQEEIKKWNNNLTENGVVGRIKKALDRNFISISVLVVTMAYIIIKDIISKG